jgi:hypothetical protein
MLKQIPKNKPILVNDAPYDPYENQMSGMMSWLTR